MGSYGAFIPVIEARIKKYGVGKLRKVMRESPAAKQVGKVLLDKEE